MRSLGRNQGNRHFFQKRNKRTAAMSLFARHISFAMNCGTMFMKARHVNMLDSCLITCIVVQNKIIINFHIDRDFMIIPFQLICIYLITQLTAFCDCRLNDDRKRLFFNLFDRNSERMK